MDGIMADYSNYQYSPKSDQFSPKVDSDSKHADSAATSPKSSTSSKAALVGVNILRGFYAGAAAATGKETATQLFKLLSIEMGPKGSIERWDEKSIAKLQKEFAGNLKANLSGDPKLVAQAVKALDDTIKELKSQAAKSSEGSAKSAPPSPPRSPVSTSTQSTVDSAKIAAETKTNQATGASILSNFDKQLQQDPAIAKYAGEMKNTLTQLVSMLAPNINPDKFSSVLQSQFTQIIQTMYPQDVAQKASQMLEDAINPAPSPIGGPKAKAPETPRERAFTSIDFLPSDPQRNQVVKEVLKQALSIAKDTAAKEGEEFFFITLGLEFNKLLPDSFNKERREFADQLEEANKSFKKEQEAKAAESPAEADSKQVDQKKSAAAAAPTTSVLSASERTKLKAPAKTDQPKVAASAAKTSTATFQKKQFVKYSEFGPFAKLVYDKFKASASDQKKFDSINAAVGLAIMAANQDKSKGSSETFPALLKKHFPSFAPPGTYEANKFALEQALKDASAAQKQQKFAPSAAQQKSHHAQQSGKSHAAAKQAAATPDPNAALRNAKIYSSKVILQGLPPVNPAAQKIIYKALESALEEATRLSANNPTQFLLHLENEYNAALSDFTQEGALILQLINNVKLAYKQTGGK